MDSLKSMEGWKVKSFNSLTSAGLLGAVPIDVAAQASKFGGCWVNGTSADVFIQVFELPAAQVTVGLTPPKFVIRIPDNTAEPANTLPLDMTHGIQMKAISVAATT